VQIEQVGDIAMTYQAAFEKIIKDEIRGHAEALVLWMNKENGNWSGLAELLNNGQGPFDTEKYCLCYCMAYMHSHYEAAKLPLARVAKSLDRKSCVAMLDIGCGPMTAALSLSDLYRDKHSKPLPLNYIGVDNSECMRAIAKKFSKRSDCFASTPDGYVAFTNGVTEITDKMLSTWLKGATVVVVTLSYVLAQNTVKQKDIEAFAELIGRIAIVAGETPIRLAYSNARIPTYLGYFLGRCAHYGAAFDRSVVSVAAHPMRQHRLKRNEIVVERPAKKDNLEYMAAKVK